MMHIKRLGAAYKSCASIAAIDNTQVVELGRPVSGLRFTSGGVEEGGDAFDYVIMRRLIR
jgi:hypothetical protein